MPKRSILPSTEFLNQRFTYDPVKGELRYREAVSSHTHAGMLVSHKVHTRVNNIKLVNSRIIWKMVNGTEPPIIVDHSDGDPLNFKWSNLRAATYSQNRHNARVNRSKSPFGYPGIWDNSKRRPGGLPFGASIHIRGRTVRLGTFPDLESAVAARRSAEVEHYGEYRSDRV